MGDVVPVREEDRTIQPQRGGRHDLERQVIVPSANLSFYYLILEKKFKCLFIFKIITDEFQLIYSSLTISDFVQINRPSTS